MPWGLKRYQQARQFHYITFTCYHGRVGGPAFRVLCEGRGVQRSRTEMLPRAGGPVPHREIHGVTAGARSFRFWQGADVQRIRR